MAKTLFYVTIVLALLVGTLVNRSPGYVLLAYEGITLQTSVWVALFCLVVIVFVAIALGRWITSVKTSGAALRRYFEARKAAKHHRFLAKGLTLWSLGETSRALRYFERTLESSELRTTAAAFLASSSSDAASRDQALAILAEGDQGQQQLAAFVRGQIAFEAGQIEAAAAAIEPLPDNALTSALRRRLAIAAKDWNYLNRQRKQISKFEETLTLADYQLILAARHSLSDDEQRDLWLRVLPKQALEDDQLLLNTLAAFDSAKLAEACCRALVESHPVAALFIVYGELHLATRDRRHQQLLRWQSQYPAAYVLAGLGVLAQKDGDYEKARDYFEQSLSHKSITLVQRRLAATQLKLGANEADAEMLQLTTPSHE